MDAKLYAPFVSAFFEVLPQFGFNEVKRGDLKLKDKLTTALGVTALIGLSKDVRGNVGYSMSLDTAQSVAGKMMGMPPVAEFDQMAQSAIAELANILTSSVVIAYEKQNLIVAISPPALITGENVTVMSQVNTLAIQIFTDAGLIEVNASLDAAASIS